MIAVRRCLVDPMKRYQSTFPDVQAAVKKRDQLVQEHLRMVQKVAKLETKEATGTPPYFTQIGNFELIFIWLCTTVNRSLSKTTTRVKLYCNRKQTGFIFIGNNIAKLAESRRQVETLANELEVQNSLLRSELPAIYEHRVDYIQPCLHALIHSQVSRLGWVSWDLKVELWRYGYFSLI